MTPRLPARWTPPAAAGQSGLFTARQAVAAGATPGQVRRRRASGGWVTVVGDALAPAGLVVTPWIVVQGVALSWPGAVVGLSTAAAFHGFPVSDDAVHLLVPRRVRRRPGVVTHELRLDPQDVVQVDEGSSRADNAPSSTASGAWTPTRRSAWSPGPRPARPSPPPPWSEHSRHVPAGGATAHVVKRSRT